MAKALRPTGPGNAVSQATPGGQAPGGSQPPGSRGTQPYLNERGEICFGNDCFTVAVDAERKEVRLTIDRDQCGDELQSTLDNLNVVLGRGATTVYVTKVKPPS